jgi:hypothetical protein
LEILFFHFGGCQVFKTNPFSLALTTNPVDLTVEGVEKTVEEADCMQKMQNRNALREHFLSFNKARRTGLTPKQVRASTPKAGFREQRRARFRKGWG